MVIDANEKQKQAIKILDGSVMLLAGPGTGKTFTIIKRIEHMIKDEDIEPSSILCLTFSDAAANEMRQRLIFEIGIIASSVNIYTYHSFCNFIIKSHVMDFDMGTNVKVIDDTEKIKIMRACIDKLRPESFAPQRADRYFWVDKFICLSEKLKSERIKKDYYMSCMETNSKFIPAYNELLAEIQEREAMGETRNKGRYDNLNKITTNIEKAKELWAIHELYSKKMKEKNLIDFADMINYVLEKFDNDKCFLEEISNNYKYFLVDEYQDTNAPQNEIIFNLVDTNKHKNIFVVGDDDQIIYSFQGAKLDNIENFLDKYPQTEVICLEENNRSTQSILDFSYNVISQDENRLENNKKFIDKKITKKLTAQNKKIILKDKKVKRLHFSEKMQEINYIIDDIVNLINSDNCPKDDEGNKKLSEIAILCKGNKELEFYSELLKHKNIRYQLSQGKSIFTIKSTILIYFYLKVLDNYLENGDQLFGILLCEPFKIDLEDYNKILHEKDLEKHKNDNFITLMKKLDNWKNPEKINNFLQTFESLKKYSQTNSLRDTILEIINRTGITECFFNEPQNKMENLMGIKKIIEDATEFEQKDPTCTFSKYVKDIDDRFNDGIDIVVDKNPLVQNAVQLTTYHKAKGREFEHVYLPNLISRLWEDYQNKSEYHLVTEEVLNEEKANTKKDTELLKLLFVGITRAKHSLTISFSDQDNGSGQQITKYLAKLDNYDFDSHYFECKEEDYEKEFVRIISKDVYDNQKAFKEEIEDKVKKIELSPSRLNDYCDCPRMFFYKKILGIDIEKRDWDSANFGTVIHGILENAIDFAKKSRKYPEADSIKKQFMDAVSNSKFSNDAKRENFEKRGLAIIEQFYPHFIQTSVDRIFDTEFDFDGVKVGDDSISGKIDRIEINNDGTYSLYDYKTGTPASQNQFKVGGSKESFYNQLCFYKYAFEKFTNKEVSQVGIIYLEDVSKSVYKTLTDEDMNYIENKIKDTYKQIKSLQFNPVQETQMGPCKFCVYKHLCKLDIL